MKHYTSPRIQRAQLFLMKVSSYLEIVCALILIVAILIAFVPVPHNLYSLYLDNGFDLSDFMKKSFDLVIGVELLKMFCRHDIDSIVEVLLFSVAKTDGHRPPCHQRSSYRLCCRCDPLRCPQVSLRTHSG